MRTEKDLIQALENLKLNKIKDTRQIEGAVTRLIQDTQRETILWVLGLRGDITDATVIRQRTK